MSDLTPETLAELRRLAELANDLPGGSDWLHGEVGDGTETVAEWMDKCSAHPDAPAAGLLRVVWSEGSGETKVIVQAIVGDTESAPIRAAFMANANPAVVLALLDAAAERDRLAGLLDEPRRSGCAVEIAGVRIAPCDERGQTADMRALDTAADHLAHMTEERDNARAEVERLTAQVEAVRKLHRPDHYLGEPGDADCPHDADYEGPRHFENDEGMWLCEDTASDESYCTGCPTDWDGEREDYPCPTIRALGAES